jgi:hypothetical protein
MSDFKSIEAFVNPQQINEISATAKMPIGMTVRAEDKASTATGVGEFVYAKGVASTVVGSVVTVDEAGVTALAAANAKGRIAVAMAATVASKFGYYQISGMGSAKVLAGFADNGVCFLTATAGSVDDADVAGDLVKGMMGRGAVSGGLAVVELNRPFVDDVADD